MYVTGLIDISLWDKAKWGGTVYGYHLGATMPPFLGLLFENPDIGKEIFCRWKKRIGDIDTHELIRISIIEGDIQKEPKGYSVFVGTNLNAVLSIAKIKGHNIDKHVLMTGRFHRMTPPQDSQNLPVFKQNYSKRGEYIFLPAIITKSGIEPIFDLGIKKKSINFLVASELKENDLEYVVLKKSPSKKKGTDILEATKSDTTAFTPERITETIAIFETELATGEIRRPIDPMVIDSLSAIKYDEKGLVVPDSVNPILVVIAEEVKDDVVEREAGRIPLINVQRKYVEFLEYYFSEPYSEMSKNNLTPHQMADIMSSDEKYVSAWKTEAPQLFQILKEHWGLSGLITAVHLRQMPALKAVYGGSIFPHPKSNLVSNVGLYADTLVLPDPVFRCLAMHDIFNTRELVYQLTKSALTAMSYSKLAIADLKVPLVVFTPSYFFLSKQLSKIVGAISQEDLRSHLQEVFGCKFDSMDDIERFFKHASSVESLAESVKNKDKFLFDIEESPLPLDQLGLIVHDFKNTVTLPNDSLSPQLMALRSFLGRFIQANDVLAHCDLYGGIPLIDAPTSWQYFLWKLEYSASQLMPDIIKDSLVAHVLHEELRDLPSFSGIPIEGAIEIRQKGTINQLREIFRKNINQIAQADSDAVIDVAKQVSSNLRDALKEYEQLINEIPKTMLDITGKTIVVAGNVGLGIAAAAYGSIPLGILAALAGNLGLPSAKDILNQSRELHKKHKLVKNSPVGLFWNIR